MTCTGFVFFVATLHCVVDAPATTAGARFCDTYKPVYWHNTDTRRTKEQVDSNNAVYKALCLKKRR